MYEKYEEHIQWAGIQGIVPTSQRACVMGPNHSSFALRAGSSSFSGYREVIPANDTVSTEYCRQQKKHQTLGF